MALHLCLPSVTTALRALAVRLREVERANDLLQGTILEKLQNKSHGRAVDAALPVTRSKDNEDPKRPAAENEEEN